MISTKQICHKVFNTGMFFRAQICILGQLPVTRWAVAQFTLRSIQPGDRIEIKPSYTRKHYLPNNGASIMGAWR